VSRNCWKTLWITTRCFYSNIHKQLRIDSL
jgi:hypothetical protein